MEPNVELLVGILVAVLLLLLFCSSKYEGMRNKNVPGLNFKESMTPAKRVLLPDVKLKDDLPNKNLNELTQGVNPGFKSSKAQDPRWKSSAEIQIDNIAKTKKDGMVGRVQYGYEIEDNVFHEAMHPQFSNHGSDILMLTDFAPQYGPAKGITTV